MGQALVLAQLTAEETATTDLLGEGFCSSEGHGFNGCCLWSSGLCKQVPTTLSRAEEVGSWVHPKAYHHNKPRGFTGAELADFRWLPTGASDTFWS